MCVMGGGYREGPVLMRFNIAAPGLNEGQFISCWALTCRVDVFP